MSYKYHFDDTAVGDLRFGIEKYRVLHESYKMLRSKVDFWNKEALKHGALNPPYEDELSDLDRMIKWGEEKLEQANDTYGEIVVNNISVGSLRYCKASLMLMIHDKEQEVFQKEREGWPFAALDSLKKGIDHIRSLEKPIAYPPADILWEIIPKKNNEIIEPENTQQWDVFISHASEDKEEFVRPLANVLKRRGLNVWFDEFTLKVGDSLRRSIDRGLASSKFGIVVISPYFLLKEWPQKELDGLAALESNGRKVILPVWHNIGVEDVKKYSPMLSDRYAVPSNIGVQSVADELISAMA